MQRKTDTNFTHRSIVVFALHEDYQSRVVKKGTHPKNEQEYLQDLTRHSKTSPSKE
jgi:hypothetical protein